MITLHAEILEWARTHGSERVRKGLEAGYRMFPLILNEWVCAHYPGFVPDIDNRGRWEISDCPSLQALLLEEKYALMEHVSEIHIVMAKEWPLVYDDTDRVLVCNLLHECLIVRDDRIFCDLVMPVE